MGDLEDRVFKQNVPGRWSSMDDSNDILKELDEGQENENDEQRYDELLDADLPLPTEEDLLVEKAREMSRADVPEPIRRRILAERMGKSKTGVKGVLEDYRTSEKLKEAYRQADMENRNSILRRIAQGARVTMPEVLVKANMDTISNEDEEEDEDDFLDNYRKKRLQEMMVTTGLPVFGSCKDVDTSTFIDEVEIVDHRVIVVIHLYEPSIAICVRVNRFLEEIARSHVHVKFLRMKASSNEIEVDVVAMPMLTFYRSGESVHVLAGLGQELGEFFKKEDLEWTIDNTIHEISEM